MVELFELQPSDESLIEGILEKKRVNIIKAEERVEQKQNLELQKTHLLTALGLLKEEERNYKQAKLFVTKFQTDKRTNDSETIRQAMKVASELVWKKTPVYPRFEDKPGQYPESNLVIDKGDFSPKVRDSEGTGLAESISLLTGVSVTNSTPYLKSFFYDELFSSVSPKNSENISELLNSIIDGSFQMTIVEQKDEIVKHADYREFRIDHDGSKSIVTTYEVDKEGNRRLLTLEELRGTNNER